MPVMDSMIEFEGNSSKHHIIQNNTQKPRRFPTPVVAPALGAAAVAPERLSLAQASLLASVLSVGGSRTPVGFLARPQAQREARRRRRPKICARDVVSKGEMPLGRLSVQIE